MKKALVFCSALVVFGVQATEVAKPSERDAAAGSTAGLPGMRYLDSFDLSLMSCGRGLTAQARRSVLGNPLTVGTNVYAHGVGVHAESAIAFRSNGKVTAFDAVVGIDAEANDLKSRGQKELAGRVFFRVYADGKLVSEAMSDRGKRPSARLHADLAGARHIVLEAADSGMWCSWWFSHADWADAAFTLAEGAVIEPVKLSDQWGVLAPPPVKAPRINGPTVYGVRPGNPVLYRVPVTGERQLDVSVSGLDGTGLAYDPATRLITGRVARTGDVPLVLVASNRYGRVERPFVVKVGSRIGLTPALGWNSWNDRQRHVTDADVRKTAETFERLGLVDHGWTYVNVDDGWMKKTAPWATRTPEADARDERGRFVPAAKFPDMKRLADFLHGKGLKLGLYSSPGPYTCAGYEGSFGHEETDAETWADWGVDYVKYDLCSYQKVIDDEKKSVGASFDERTSHRRPYAVMGECLRRQKRDIVYSLCQYGRGSVADWAAEVGAQSWRASGDLKDGWSFVYSCVTSRAEAWKKAQPGCWLDFDMMVVGPLTTFDVPHDSYLTPNEQYAHMGLWALLASPILLGHDVARTDAFTLSLLTNDELLDIHQDALGRMAGMVWADDGATQVWSRPLENGDWAVGVLNVRSWARRTTLDLAALGLKGECAVRDIWRQRDLGIFETGIPIDVPAHALAVLRVSSRPPCKDCR